METAGWWLIPGGRIGSIVVVVDVPNAYCLSALLVGGPFAGVEEFLGRNPLVAFDLSLGRG